MKRSLVIFMIFALVLCMFSGCDGDNSGLPGLPGSDTTAPPEKVDFSKTDADMFTDRDLSGEYENAQQITLGSGDVAITKPGTYLLSGTLEQGRITVNVTGENDKVQLVLAGAHISCEDGAAICILDADKVFLTLQDGTENTVAVGKTIGTLEGHELDAAIYSRADLTINGSGSLTITAPAGQGISCKDDLAITGGEIHVTCANQGIDANDSIRISGGTITVDAGKDGIHAENAEDASLGFVYISGGVFQIECEGDGISAGAYLQIENGTFTILAGGGYENGNNASSGGWGGMGGGMRPGSSSATESEDAQSMKGLKVANSILISAGTFDLDTADDAIHADASITINGGTYTVASGDDAVHAKDTLTVTACDMTVEEAYEGLEAEKIYVKGGTLWLNCSDDGLNASGGADASGTTGGRDGMFGGGRPGGPGGPGGGMGANENAIIAISGGNLTIYSCGDGLDSNGNLTMSGGYVYATNPRSGDVSVLDSQNQPVITGGIYIGLGASTMMAETFSAKTSTQGFLGISGGFAAGTEIRFADKNGNEILSITTEYATQLIIVSCPQMIKGDTYTITAGEISKDFSAS